MIAWYNHISTGFILPDYHYIQQETEIKQLIERYNSDRLLDRTGRQIKGIDDTLAVDTRLFLLNKKILQRYLRSEIFSSIILFLTGAIIFSPIMAVASANDSFLTIKSGNTYYK